METSLSRFWELVMHREAGHAMTHGVTKSGTRLGGWIELTQGVWGWENVINLISSHWWPETGTVKTIYLWKYQSPTTCCLQLLRIILFLRQIMLSCSYHIISEFLWITVSGCSSTLVSLYHLSKYCFFSLQGIAGHLGLPICLQQSQAAVYVLPACAADRTLCADDSRVRHGPRYPVRLHKKKFQVLLILTAQASSSPLWCTR